MLKSFNFNVSMNNNGSVLIALIIVSMLTLSLSIISFTSFNPLTKLGNKTYFCFSASR